YHAASRAHVKLRRSRAVFVMRDELGLRDGHHERARGVRRPHATVLDAEGAAARARRDRHRSGLPGQLERDVAAVAGAANHLATSATSSISTHDPNGTCATPNALRACAPCSPKTCASNSDAPLATRCCCVKAGVLF